MASSRAQSGSSRGRVRGRDNDSPQVRLSKSLSYLLRHGAAKEGIPMRPDGFVALADVLARPQFAGVQLCDIQDLVRTNDKQRYALQQEPESGVWLIRANQGHSLNVDVDMAVVTDPSDLPVVVHGTYTQHLPSIFKTGLSRMGRKHIHFAVGLLGQPDVTSGMRSSCTAFIYINVALAMQDGIVFMRSANNVVLSEGINGSIPPKYFDRVVNRDGAPIAQ
ncbi:phosphotransferase KptA/Tpt1 [Entophlyctis helioformis]|nr:phosphotransferase KptA/Tpt1 [Entophlyctis helioformis]